MYMVCLLCLFFLSVCTQQLISECKKSQSRAHREKAIKIEQVMRNYPHDPDHPGIYIVQATLYPRAKI